MELLYYVINCIRSVYFKVHFFLSLTLEFKNVNDSYVGSSKIFVCLFLLVVGSTCLLLYVCVKLHLIVIYFCCFMYIIYFCRSFHLRDRIYVRLQVKRQKSCIRSVADGERDIFVKWSEDGPPHDPIQILPTEFWNSVNEYRS